MTDEIFTPEEIEKLPRWAASKVGQLQSELRAAFSDLRTIRGENHLTMVEYRPRGARSNENGAGPINAPNDAAVRFILTEKSGREQWIEVSFAWRGTGRISEAVQIRTNSGIAILPDSSNSALVTVRENLPAMVRKNQI